MKTAREQFEAQEQQRTIARKAQHQAMSSSTGVGAAAGIAALVAGLLAIFVICR